MKSLFCAAFFSLLAQAHGLEDHFNAFFNEVNEDWGRFEFSIEYSSDFKSVLMDVSAARGLEDLEVQTLINQKDLESFVEDLFRTPYGIPHFCYALKDFEREDLWSLPEPEIAFLCRQKVEKLTFALLSGHFQLRSFKLYGENGDDNFYKAKLMAEDVKKEKSVVINFDVVID